MGAFNSLFSLYLLRPGFPLTRLDATRSTLSTRHVLCGSLLSSIYLSALHCITGLGLVAFLGRKQELGVSFVVTRRLYPAGFGRLCFDCPFCFEGLVDWRIFWLIGQIVEWPCRQGGFYVHVSLETEKL